MRTGELRGRLPSRKLHRLLLPGMSFAAGSMGPKVEAACAFASIAGRIAGIGRLEDARAILEGRKGNNRIAIERLKMSTSLCHVGMMVLPLHRLASRWPR